MDNGRIVALSNQLREEGMSVSVRSTQMACDVWNLMKSSTEMDDVKTALKSVYLKDHHDNKKFNKVFDELFVEEQGQEFKTNVPYDDSRDDHAIEREDLMGMPDSVETDMPIEKMLPPEFDPESLQPKKIHEKDILKTDINHLNTFDERVVDLCRKLGQKIANQRSKRNKRLNSTNINMPRTIRSNLKNGGKLINLKYNKPHINKTKHVFLSDISGSCDWISNWFFSIIYGCQKSFDKIYCYDFDNKIMETTDALKTESYELSYEKVTLQKIQRGMIHGQSDMTSAFKEFLNNAPLNHRTDVIILTDCRDWKVNKENGVLESAVVLERIVRKSSKVMIFNPEGKDMWDTPTSRVHDYQNVGAHVHEIRNLEHLAELITKL